MKNYSLITIIVVLFNYFISFTNAENNFYIVGIKRSDDDDNYSKASKSIQNAINELVNDRLNDIYEIVEDNVDTYVSENGEMDEILNELEDNAKIRKRSNESGKPIKYRFINHNAPENNRPFKRDSESDVEYIPIESKIVGHICPIKNYYAVKAYLSPSIVDDVKNLSNVVLVEKSNVASNEGTVTPYYNLDMIQKETKWLNVSVQENGLFGGKNFFSNLSLISQGIYKEHLTKQYDNNYYYPSSAGKDIDIYLIDEGIYMTSGSRRYEDYDTYAGTPDERTITCDARIHKGEIILYPPDTVNCYVDGDAPGTPHHGNMVMSIAGGKLYGAAKKANLHMLATGYLDIDELAALYYIKRYATPHKTIVSISRGHYEDYRESFDDLLNELVDEGFIFFTSAGNIGEECCYDKYSYRFKNFAGYENMIVVGATENTIGSDMKDAYRKASYSNTGKCVFIHAPGEVIYPPVDSPQYNYNGMRYMQGDGTSCATPLVAGVAATIMSEYPEIKFNTRIMKDYLKDFSFEGIIKGVNGTTPNRFLNNGKRTVFSPLNEYNGCGESSGRKMCSSGCCTKDSECVEPSQDKNGLCEYKNDVQYLYGTYSIDGEFYPAPIPDDNEIEEPFEEEDEPIPDFTNRIGEKCGPGYDSCIVKDDEKGIIYQLSCCSKDGICGTTEEFCGTGCQTKYGACYEFIFDEELKITNSSSIPTLLPPSSPPTKTTTNINISPTKIPKSRVSGKCGPEYGYCQESGYCCSQYGFCGTTAGYCGTGCQPEYGVCK